MIDHGRSELRNLVTEDAQAVLGRLDAKCATVLLHLTSYFLHLTCPTSSYILLLISCILHLTSCFLLLPVSYITRPILLLNPTSYRYALMREETPVGWYHGEECFLQVRLGGSNRHIINNNDNHASCR